MHVLFMVGGYGLGAYSQHFTEERILQREVYVHDYIRRHPEDFPPQGEGLQNTSSEFVWEGTALHPWDMGHESSLAMCIVTKSRYDTYYRYIVSIHDMYR